MLGTGTRETNRLGASTRLPRRRATLGLNAVIAIAASLAAAGVACAAAAPPPSDGAVLKRVLHATGAEPNLLVPENWSPWGAGFTTVGGLFVCDNGLDATVERGLGQTVLLNQDVPRAIVAAAWSRAEAVGGGPDADYSLYLDLIYTDGTPLWGEIAPFSVGTHDWERREVVVLPEKPVRSVSVYLLLRRHAGRAWFREPVLQEVRPPQGAALFDGLPVTLESPAPAGFQVRDVGADSDFVRIEREALGLALAVETSAGREGASFYDITISDRTGRDRAITLVYAMPVTGDGGDWLASPRRTEPMGSAHEHVNASSVAAGANGRLSRYPFGAVTVGGQGLGLGIDLAWPVFFRTGYSAGTRELFVACDIGLTPERPAARLRLCRFAFAPAWGFRAALAQWYALFPDQFECRVPEQGLWMPFARISEVAGWEDFGFAFKEGNNETRWDDAHGIVTFRYTEPMTWWMPMAPELPRTLAAALAEANRLATAEASPWARGLLASGFLDESGALVARLLDTPWCDGAVWSMNSAPGIPGEYTDFKNKWNPALRQELYGPGRDGDLDGEYIDSSECYVTAELDFDRRHFAAMATPLAFARDSRRPGIYKGLAVFEYVRGIAADVRAMGKLMMANGTPDRLCWLAPLLDVMGTETDWAPGGVWHPMDDGALLQRRALCRGKPYCFLMNTDFGRFPPALVERYMQRALAYGMFPGFFSHNAAEGHYFTRPELYERDRPLFKKYVPLCKLVAEAGWEPITRARSSDARVYVERFGTRYLTVFNDTDGTRTTTITIEGDAPRAAARELVGGGSVEWTDGAARLTLAPETVAVLELAEPIAGDRPLASMQEVCAARLSIAVPTAIVGGAAPVDGDDAARAVLPGHVLQAARDVGRGEAGLIGEAADRLGQVAVGCRLAGDPAAGAGQDAVEVGVIEQPQGGVAWS